MKNKYLLIVLSCLFFAGCAKYKPTLNNSKTTVSTTIKATGGANQQDTVGRTLLDSVIVKINEPGSNLNKLFVKIFQTTLCNGDSIISRQILNGGSVSYKWTLNSKPGLQTLKFQVLDNSQNIIDSLNVTATALPPSPGWHVGSCIIPHGLAINNFAKTSTGRILAGVPGDFNPLYSDDNGATWKSMTSFYKYQGYYPWVQKIVLSPTDEIYIASELNGIFYSSNGGATWQNRSAGIPPLVAFSDLALSPSGRLLFTTNGGGIYVSDDKAMSWTTISPDSRYQLIGHAYMGTEDNGDVYLAETINFVSKLRLLNHATGKVTDLTGLPPITPGTFYIDNSGTRYYGGLNQASNMVELYQSTDKNLTWKKIFSFAANGIFASIFTITKQSDNNYYFVANDGGQVQYYYQTKDFTSFQKMAIPKNINLYGPQYILANNGNFLISTYPNCITYRVQ